MSSKYADDSLLYIQIYTKSIWRNHTGRMGYMNRKAVFELFFRNLPFGNGYALFAGFERVLDYLRDFQFSESDLAYLKDELGYKEDFISII